MENNDQIIKIQSDIIKKTKLILNNLIKSFENQDMNIQKEIDFIKILSQNKYRKITNENFNQDIEEISNMISFLLNNYFSKMIFVHQNKVVNAIILNLLNDFFTIYIGLNQNNQTVKETTMNLFGLYTAILDQCILDKNVPLPNYIFWEMIELKKNYLNNVDLSKELQRNVEIYFYRSLLPKSLFLKGDNYLHEIIDMIKLGEDNKEELFIYFKQIGEIMQKEKDEIYKYSIENNLVDLKDYNTKNVFEGNSMLIEDFSDTLINDLEKLYNNIKKI